MSTKRRHKRIPRSKAKNAYELLSEISELIMDEPKRYDQHCWLDTEGGHAKQPDCGTVGCIAGWIVILRAKRLPSSMSGIQERATRILGLKDDQTWDLFHGNACGYTKEQTQAHARRGAQHIKDFQTAYKEQLLRKRV
jgi:hypothetical protein